MSGSIGHAQFTQADFVSDDAIVEYTSNGTPYLTEPGVVLLTQPVTSLECMRNFLTGFDIDLNYLDYLEDPDKLTGAEAIAKAAGQICYMSFGPNRTKNADAGLYFDRIKEQGHGSILEHAQFAFLWYGVSRSLTMELIRHRAGFGFSQVSQCYVDDKALRFVERPEYYADQELHLGFKQWIDACAAEYRARANRLREVQETDPIQRNLFDSKTANRKKVNQAARGCLPNETEAPIVFSANVRGLRHMFEVRAAKGAEVEIGRAAIKTLRILKQVAGNLFNDYTIHQNADGFETISTPYRKV